MLHGLTQEWVKGKWEKKQKTLLASQTQEPQEMVCYESPKCSVINK